MQPWLLRRMASLVERRRVGDVKPKIATIMSNFNMGSCFFGHVVYFIA